MPAGSTSSANVILINSGGTPINFRVISPVLRPIVNETTPTVVSVPMNGTIAPHSQMNVSIRVSVAAKDKPGLTWTGVWQAVEVTNNTASGPTSALLTAGVAKIITIDSAKPLPFPVIYIVIIALVVVIAVGLAAYFLLFSKSHRRKQ
ncbi:MAG: hypothetical protein QXN59_02270 [Candidatus Micrarchaeaceae archaeon]